MSYSPNRGRGYGNVRRGSGSGYGYGRGNNNRNVNRDYVGGVGVAGSLRDYGWVATAPEEQRRQALLNCVRAEGFGATSIKLQVLFQSTGVPEVDRAIEEDIAWLTTEAQLSP